MLEIMQEQVRRELERQLEEAEKGEGGEGRNGQETGGRYQLEGKRHPPREGELAGAH